MQISALDRFGGERSCRQGRTAPQGLLQSLQFEDTRILSNSVAIEMDVSDPINFYLLGTRPGQSVGLTYFTCRI